MGKSVWIALALCLSVALFGFAVGMGNLKDFRQLIIFVVSCVQIGAMIVLVVTLIKLRRLIERQE